MSSNNTKHPLYFIALIPPAKIIQEVDVIKNQLKNKFGVNHALKLEAHITLQIPFRMAESKEVVLTKKLQNFAAKHQIITTELEGFGRFAKNVIFIQVKDHEPFIKLHADLQDLMLSFIDLKSHEISSKIHPHVTLATRDLKRSHFPEIWDYFKDKEYSSSVTFQKLYLLKHNGKTWEALKAFNLND